MLRSPPTARVVRCGFLSPTNSATLPSPTSSKVSTCSPPQSKTATTAACAATTPPNESTTSSMTRRQPQQPSARISAMTTCRSDRQHPPEWAGRFSLPATPPARARLPPSSARHSMTMPNPVRPATPLYSSPAHPPPPDVGNPCTPGITLTARDSPPTRSRHSHLPDCGRQHRRARQRHSGDGLGHVAPSPRPAGRGGNGGATRGG